MTTPHHNLKLLVGSRAIQYYIDLSRPVKDWDIWMEQTVPHNQILDGQLIDYHQITENEQTLIQTLELDKLPSIDSPIGPVSVSPLWFNYLLKASHYSINKKAKHLQDFQLLHKLKLIKPDNFDELLLKRFQDTQSRQALFFDESVPRILPHDWVHLQVAQALGFELPAFVSLLNNDDYLASESDFEQLPYELKKRCVLEEAVVLGLERWLIYNVASRPGSLIQRWEVFCSGHSPAIEWLERLGASGRVMRNPEYISQFIQQHYVELIQELPLILCHLKTNMSQSWWTGLLGIRCEKQSL